MSHQLPASTTNTSPSTTRKKRRGQIEKKRRDKINFSLTELRRLVPAAFEKQASGKLEKAEILQMTVDYLKKLHESGLADLLTSSKRLQSDHISISRRQQASTQAAPLPPLTSTPKLAIKESSTAPNSPVSVHNHHSHHLNYSQSSTQHNHQLHQQQLASASLHQHQQHQHQHQSQPQHAAISHYHHPYHQTYAQHHSHYRLPFQAVPAPQPPPPDLTHSPVVGDHYHSLTDLSGSSGSNGDTNDNGTTTSLELHQRSMQQQQQQHHHQQQQQQQHHHYHQQHQQYLRFIC